MNYRSPQVINIIVCISIKGGLAFTVWLCARTFSDTATWQLECGSQSGDSLFTVYNQWAGGVIPTSTFGQALTASKEDGFLYRAAPVDKTYLHVLCEGEVLPGGRCDNDEDVLITYYDGTSCFRLLTLSIPQDYESTKAECESLLVSNLWVSEYEVAAFETEAEWRATLEQLLMPRAEELEPARTTESLTTLRETTLKTTHEQTTTAQFTTDVLSTTDELTTLGYTTVKETTSVVLTMEHPLTTETTQATTDVHSTTNKWTTWVDTAIGETTRYAETSEELSTTEAIQSSTLQITTVHPTTLQSTTQDQRISTTLAINTEDNVSTEESEATEQTSTTRQSSRIRAITSQHGVSTKHADTTRHTTSHVELESTTLVVRGNAPDTTETEDHVQLASTNSNDDNQHASMQETNVSTYSENVDMFHTTSIEDQRDLEPLLTTESQITTVDQIDFEQEPLTESSISDTVNSDLRQSTESEPTNSLDTENHTQKSTEHFGQTLGGVTFNSQSDTSRDIQPTSTLRTRTHESKTVTRSRDTTWMIASIVPTETEQNQRPVTCPAGCECSCSVLGSLSPGQQGPLSYHQAGTPAPASTATSGATSRRPQAIPEPDVRLWHYKVRQVERPQLPSDLLPSPDSEPISVAIGSVTIITMVVVLAAILAVDASSLWRDVRMLGSNLRCAVRFVRIRLFPGNENATSRVEPLDETELRSLSETALWPQTGTGSNGEDLGKLDGSKSEIASQDTTATFVTQNETVESRFGTASKEYVKQMILQRLNMLEHPEDSNLI